MTTYPIDISSVCMLRVPFRCLLGWHKWSRWQQMLIFKIRTCERCSASQTTEAD